MPPGRSVPRDDHQAIALLRTHAKRDSIAAYGLGLMYAEGRGVPRDDEFAGAWFQRAAADGSNKNAMYSLGRAHLLGRGVPQDDGQAAAWFRRAGTIEAKYSLGVMYTEGIGVPKDYQRAFEWFRRAENKPEIADTAPDADSEVQTMETYNLADESVPGDRTPASPEAAIPEVLQHRLPPFEPVPWDDIRHFFEMCGCVMVGGPEMRWYQESWAAVVRARSSNIDSHEFISKLQAICLLKMYLGIYQQDRFSEMGCYFEDDEPFSLSQMIDILDIDWPDLVGLVVREGFFDLANIWDTLRDDGENDVLVDRAIEEHLTWEGVRDLLRDEGREELIEWAMEAFFEHEGLVALLDMIREEVTLIYNAIANHYGGDAGLFTSIWNSRKPLDEAESIEACVNSDVSEGKLSTWLYIENGMNDWR